MPHWREKSIKGLQQIRTIKVSSLDQGCTSGSIQKANQPESSSSEDENEEEKEKLKNAIKLFAERVTVAGVEDLYKSKIKFERWMWYVTMLAICVGVVWKCHSKTKEYIHPAKKSNHYPIANSMPPFPNLSICGPMSVDKEKFQKLLIIPQKTQKLIKRKNLSFEEIIDFTLNFWRYDRLPVEIDKPLIAQASRQIMDATAFRYPRILTDLFLLLYPKCEETLSSCTFYGQEFDCCRIAQFTWTQDSICYYFDLNPISKALKEGLPSDDPSHLQETGLSVNFNFNWPSIYDGVMQNGFLITIDHLWMGSIPSAIPAGADALVTLAATKEEWMTNCHQPNKARRLEFFSDYAPTDAIISADLFVRSLASVAGCDWPVQTYLPKINSTFSVCPPFVLYVFKTFLAQNSKTQYDSDKIDSDYTKSDAWKGSTNNRLCQQWNYEIKSVSYGYVYDNRGHALQENPNITEETWQWSRLRIFFPTASYLFIEEEPASPIYVAMCNIGGSICMYCGVSMISFIQLIIYGGFLLSVIIWKYWKKVGNKNKVAPAADGQVKR